jgi:hypothetical protein
VLSPYSENDPYDRAFLSAFARGLAELGWSDGRNLRMEVLKLLAAFPADSKVAPASFAVMATVVSISDRLPPAAAANIAEAAAFSSGNSPMDIQAESDQTAAIVRAFSAAGSAALGSFGKAASTSSDVMPWPSAGIPRASRRDVHERLQQQRWPQNRNK